MTTRIKKMQIKKKWRIKRGGETENGNKPYTTTSMLNDNGEAVKKKKKMADEEK